MRKAMRPWRPPRVHAREAFELSLDRISEWLANYMGVSALHACDDFVVSGFEAIRPSAFDPRPSRRDGSFEGRRSKVESPRSRKLQSQSRPCRSPRSKGHTGTRDTRIRSILLPSTSTI